MTVNNDESDNSGGAGGSKKEVVLLLLSSRTTPGISTGKSWISSSSPNHNYYLQLLTDHLLNQLEQRL
jgi:hypothetical protein